MIGADELQRWIDELARFGRLPDAPDGSPGGNWRRPYTPEDEAAIAYVADLCRAAGMAVRRDEAGNTIARFEGSHPEAGVVGTGSHLDSVRAGGKYDGPLGVLAGLAAIKDVTERRGTPHHPLELVIWESEEGNRYTGLLGCRAMVDGLTEADFDQLIDADGISASDAMRSVGLNPSLLPPPRRDDIAAFIELHIEQGYRLERSGTRIGIVSAIVTGRRVRASFIGAAGHAGTTPMDDRRDALQGAAEFVLAGTRYVESLGAPAVLTCGQFNPVPNAPNVIPGRVDLTLDNRDGDRARLASTTTWLEATAREIGARRGLTVEWSAIQGIGSGPMDQRLQGILRDVCDEAGISHTPLFSGAGHDCGAIARIAPAAMLFVPSVNGYSHRPDEYTPIENCLDGVRVLAGALERLAYR